MGEYLIEGTFLQHNLRHAPTGFNTHLNKKLADFLTFIEVNSKFCTADYFYTFTLSDGLLNSFEAGDARRTAWVRQVTLNGITASEPYKYQNYDTESATDSQRFEAPTVIRLAELYLIRAEANAALGNSQLVLSDLNIIRARAGLPSLSSAVNLNDAVLQERRIELFCERGDRWLTLKRTGQVNTVLSAAKPATWQSYAQWFPLPQTAIDSNPNLIQNQGYR